MSDHADSEGRPVNAKVYAAAELIGVLARANDPRAVDMVEIEIATARLEGYAAALNDLAEAMAAKGDGGRDRYPPPWLRAWVRNQGADLKTRLEAVQRRMAAFAPAASPDMIEAAETSPQAAAMAAEAKIATETYNAAIVDGADNKTAARAASDAVEAWRAEVAAAAGGEGL